jgi:hypothetical protein
MVAKQLCTNHTVQAVGADQNITARRLTVRESCRDSYGVLDESRALVIELQELRIYLAGEHA